MTAMTPILAAVLLLALLGLLVRRDDGQRQTRRRVKAWRKDRLVMNVPNRRRM